MSVNILLTGDLCPHNRIEKLAVQGNFDEIFNDFRNVFKGNDLNITDLECPLTESMYGRAKTGPHQKAKPVCINILSHVNIGLAAMANNHIMDYGSAGAKETINLCNKVGIATVGIGENEKNSRLPFVYEKEGKKIAILNFGDKEFLTAPDGSIQANPVNAIANYYDLYKAKAENDFVILIVHAGNEFYHLPSPRTKELYRFYADAGADAIMAHHTHNFSGYEIYKGKPIFYGLGNFIYDWPGKVNTSWNKGFVVRLKISDIIDFEIIPLKQCNEQPGVFHLSIKEKFEFEKEIDTLNTIIADDSRLESEFAKYCASVYPMYDAFIEPYFGKWITAFQKRGLLPKLMTRHKRLLLLNITRCESHREVLHRLLKKYE